MLLDEISKIASSDIENKVVIDTAYTSDLDLRKTCGPHRVCILNQKEALNSGIMMFAISNGSVVIAPKNDHNIEIRDSLRGSWLRLYEQQLNGDIINSLIKEVAPSEQPSLDLHGDVGIKIYFFINELLQS
jgi:hypothetical protein